MQDKPYNQKPVLRFILPFLSYLIAEEKQKKDRKQSKHGKPTLLGQKMQKPEKSVMDDEKDKEDENDPKTMVAVL